MDWASITSTRAYVFLAAVNLPQRGMTGDRSSRCPYRRCRTEPQAIGTPVRFLSAPAYRTRKRMSAMTFDDSSLPPVLPEDAATLVTAVAGSVLLPGDAGYDDERAVFNLNHELVPAVIVVAQSAADVQAAVAFAAGQHRPVLVKTTGHQMVGTARGAVVIATHRMNDVDIDAVGRTARVGAGAIWSEVIAEGGQSRAGPAERVESHGGSRPVTPWAAVSARPSAAPTATPPTMCARSTW